MNSVDGSGAAADAHHAEWAHGIVSPPLAEKVWPV
jgi:hypothetical protein